MAIVNHLKDLETQNLFHAVAYGQHLVTGNLAKSSVAGTDPTHVITLQQMLGRGPWNACKGLWWKGVEVKSDKYIFRPGTQSTGMGDSTQGQSAVFDTDTPHSGVAWIEAELAEGMGDADTASVPPYGLKGIFETMKIDDYDETGAYTGNSYSTNPARQVADLMIRLGGIPTSRIDWDAWDAWSNYLTTTISYDYTAITNFDGFGLTGSFYNGTAFDTLITSRIDPVLEFVSSAGSPAVGVDVDNFSVRWEGKIKAKFSETYTFYVNHTHGAKVYVNDMGTPIIDQWTTTGEHSGTFAFTAGTFYDIKVEWKHTTSNADFKLEWTSTSQEREVVSHRALYPKTVSRPRYETHPFFAGPTRLDDAVRTILNLCHSTVQEANGQLKFFCLEQLSSSSYNFTNDTIVDSSVKVIPRDVTALRNSWKAKFRDIDSQYMEEPIDPIIIERPDLITAAGRKIDGEAIEMFNCTPHQANRSLENWVKRTVDPTFQIQLTGMPDSFKVLAGDRVAVDVEFLDWSAKNCVVLESNDASSEETAEERTFTVQEWML